MYNNKILFSAKQIYYASRRMARLLFSLIKVKKDRLIFVFGGRNDGWSNVGRNTYVTSFAFKEVIQNCNSILTEMGGSEILSYFENPIDEHFFDDESRFTCITAIQLATVKLYNDNGFFPNAVMGISLGEPAAAYAVGALTLKETLKIALGYMTIYKLERMQYIFLFINLDFKAALKLCEESPVWIEIIYEDSPHAVLVTCDKDNIDELEIFLKLKQIIWKLAADKTFIPYHTSLIQPHHKILYDFFKDIEPRPLKCDYYSPTLGEKIPKGTIFSSNYWHDLACVPVLFSTTLRCVINDGYKSFLQIGPPGISDRQLKNVIQSPKIKLFNSFLNEPDELHHHQWINKKLKGIRFELSSVSDKSELNTLNEFKQHFNIYSETTSTLQYEYLRKNGPIHFLPVHNSWILLNYDDIDYVLKQPEIFSSSILKEYDPILLGANPESHSVMRGLLHPLFSPAVIAELGKFTLMTAEHLLDVLCTEDSFDFVKDYSDPLSLLVLCNFFGLSSSDANDMLNFTGKDYHDMLYWQRLEEYFNDRFMVSELINVDSLWGKLRELVRKDQFVYADAISLMKIIWTAGMATTSALISTAINITLKQPQFADQICTDEKLVSKFIEECLRLQTPITAVHRITTREVELAGQHLPANMMVMLNLKSAMTDPTHFSDPEKFSVTRPAKRHLAFGSGIHQCIGMGIARAEARSALQIVLTKLPELRNYTSAQPVYTKASDLQTMSSLRLFKSNS